MSLELSCRLQCDGEQETAFMGADHGTRVFTAGLAEDIRYALRGIRGNPGFSLIVIATLAVGIGINAAAFAISSAFLLRGFSARRG